MGAYIDNNNCCGDTTGVDLVMVRAFVAMLYCKPNALLLDPHQVLLDLFTAPSRHPSPATARFASALDGAHCTAFEAWQRRP